MAVCECCGSGVKKVYPSHRRNRDTKTNYLFFVCGECRDIDEDKDFFRKQKEGRLLDLEKEEQK